MLMFFAAELALVVGKFMPTVRNAVVADPAPARAAGLFARDKGETFFSDDAKKLGFTPATLQ
ncbi:hypothetical protein ACWD4T_45190, partial [Streptomyces umbrinus]